MIVTGGSRGLGATLVDAFLRDGDRVATCSRTPTAEIEAWASDPQLAERFHYEAFDITDRSACAAFIAGTVARFGSIEVLVNNAACCTRRRPRTNPGR